MNKEIIPEWLRNHPLTRQILAEKAAETIGRRTGIAAKISELRTELKVASGPDQALIDMQAEIDRLEHKRAAVWKKFTAAYATRRGKIQGLQAQIAAAEADLLADYDPQIDEAIEFFRGHLDKLRMPSTIRSVEHKRTPKSPLNNKQEIYRSSNVPSVLEAVTYCRDALAELEAMKLLPAVDAGRIETLMESVPDHSVYEETEVFDFPIH